MREAGPLHSFRLQAPARCWPVRDSFGMRTDPCLFALPYAHGSTSPGKLSFRVPAMRKAPAEPVAMRLMSGLPALIRKRIGLLPFPLPDAVWPACRLTKSAPTPRHKAAKLIRPQIFRLTAQPADSAALFHNHLKTNNYILTLLLQLRESIVACLGRADRQAFATHGKAGDACAARCCNSITQERRPADTGAGKAQARAETCLVRRESFRDAVFLCSTPLATPRASSGWAA